MLGENWFRSIWKHLPLHQDQTILVKITNVRGRLLILENSSDLEKKKRAVRRYCFAVSAKLTGCNLSNEEEVNRFDGELSDLVYEYALIDLKSAEMRYCITPGIRKRCRGNLTLYSSRRV